MRYKKIFLCLLPVLLFLCFYNISFAKKWNFQTIDEIPKVPEFIYDFAEEHYDYYLINTCLTPFSLSVTICEYDLENSYTKYWDVYNGAKTYKAYKIIRSRIYEYKDEGTLEFKDELTGLNCYIKINEHGEYPNDKSVFDSSVEGWKIINFANFDITYEGKLIRKADILNKTQFEIIQTDDSIDVDYNFKDFDKMQIEVYEYDFKNMQWNQDTKEVFDVPVGDNIFEYKQGIGNKYSCKKYYGFEIKAYKDSQVVYNSETVLPYGVGSRYQVLPKDNNEYIYSVSSPRNVQLGQVNIEDKDYYGLTWDTSGELFNVEVQIKNVGEDFTHVSLLKNGEDTYICSYSDEIESFRLRKIDKDNEERFSDWVVIDKDSSIVYHGNDYYLDNGFYPNGKPIQYDETRIMELKPVLPDSYNPIDYVKFIIKSISWFITYILFLIRNFIAQVGNIPIILQEIIPFLPWEVTTMLSAGVAVSILLRIFGKR